MSDDFTPRAGWGPDRRRAALSITFDNFGEAADLELGFWGDRPVGTHPVPAFVPDLIEALDGIRATYFVEGSNVALYPLALRRWHEAGHEVGIHAWRHEFWAKCDADRRRSILARSVEAFRTLGIEAVGFRPPGGTLPPAAWREFAHAGLLYASPLGDPVASRHDGVIALPFRWPDVDVFMIDEVLGFLRVELGRSEQPIGLADWQRRVLASLDEAVQRGGHRVMIFHPHSLLGDPARLAIVRDLIAAARAADVWIAPTQEVARFVATEINSAKRAVFA